MSDDSRTPEQKHFAAYLKKRMTDRSKSVHQLHTDTDVSRNTIRAALQGKSKPNLNTIGRLLKELDGARSNGDPDKRPFQAFIQEQEAEAAEGTAAAEDVRKDEAGAAPDGGGAPDQHQTLSEDDTGKLTALVQEASVAKGGEAPALEPEGQEQDDDSSTTPDDDKPITGKVPVQSIIQEQETVAAEADAVAEDERKDETGAAPDGGGAPDQQQTLSEDGTSELKAPTHEVSVAKSGEAPALEPEGQERDDDSFTIPDDDKPITDKGSDVQKNPEPPESKPKKHVPTLAIAVTAVVAGVVFFSQNKKSNPEPEQEASIRLDGDTVAEKVESAEPVKTSPSEEAEIVSPSKETQNSVASDDGETNHSTDSPSDMVVDASIDQPSTNIVAEKNADSETESEEDGAEADDTGPTVTASSLYEDTGLRVMGNGDQRIIAYEVNSDSEAYRRGISAGDIIDKIDTVKMTNLDQFYKIYKERLKSNEGYLPLTLKRENPSKQQKLMTGLVDRLSKYKDADEETKADAVKYSQFFIVLSTQKRGDAPTEKPQEISARHPQWQSLKQLGTINIDLEDGKKERLRPFGAQYKTYTTNGFAFDPRISLRKSTARLNPDSNSHTYEILAIDRKSGKFLRLTDYTKLVEHLSETLGYPPERIKHIAIAALQDRYILSIYDEGWRKFRLVALSFTSDILWISQEFRGQHETIATNNGIITGYGSGSSKDYVSILDIYTGKETFRKLIASQPSLIDLHGNQLIVQTYVNAYKFELEY